MVVLGIGSAVGALVPLAASGAAPAPAVTKTVAATATLQFSPQVVSVPLSGTVHWTFSGPTHTSTATKPGGYWDSGNRAAGTTFDRVFKQAGTFPYHCIFHASFGMTGTVKVPMNVSPGSGTTSTQFTITWALAVPTGYTFDVQSKAPGATAFTTVFSHSTAKSVTRTLGTAGTWTWRARLVHTTNGETSNWSPAKTVPVS